MYSITGVIRFASRGHHPQHGILLQQIVVTFLLRRAELRQMFRADDHAERHPARQRNPPTPAVIEPRRMNVALVVQLRLVHVREQRRVLARAFSLAMPNSFGSNRTRPVASTIRSGCRLKKPFVAVSVSWVRRTRSVLVMRSTFAGVS